MSEKMWEAVLDFFKRNPQIFGFGVGIFFVLAGLAGVKSESGIKFDLSGNWPKKILIFIGALLLLYSLYVFIRKLGRSNPNSTIVTNSETSRLFEMLKSHIAINEFHYLSIIEETTTGYNILAEAEIFNDEMDTTKHIKTHFNVDYKKKIEQYRSYAVKMIRVAIDFDNKLDGELQQGDLIRLIFDVKDGGVFYGKLYVMSDRSETKRYLFGSTLEQTAMDECARIFGLLVDAYRDEKHLPKIVFSAERQKQQ